MRSKIKKFTNLREESFKTLRFSKVTWESSSSQYVRILLFFKTGHDIQTSFSKYSVGSFLPVRSQPKPHCCRGDLGNFTVVEHESN